uniref:Uncharacterized protein n=1 Tax=Latimeria chalumnae TaxID=7897 RepID=H3ANZ2_LATCH
IMAFVHCGSEECVKSEQLDLFTIAPTQTSIEKSLYVEIPLLSALSESAPIEFYIVGNGEDYLDLNNTLLYIVCKIIKADGSTIAHGAKVGLINYPVVSIFSQVDITVGDCLISQSNHCYPYRAYIESILNYSRETLDTQFSTGLVYRDTPGEHEDFDLDGDNEGFKKRNVFTAFSRKVELMGRLHAGLFFQEKLMLNGVDVKIKLIRNKDEFCLLSGDADERYKLKIISTLLFVKKVKVSPRVRLSHAEALLMANTKYPIDRVGMKVLSIAAGSCVCNQENLFLGQLPKLIVIGFVDNDSFSGVYHKNPFNFKHYNINFVALYMDGEQVPVKPLQPDFQTGNAIREYCNLIQAAGKHLKYRLLVINRENFCKGYTLFRFDLTPDQECSDHYSLIKTGKLRAEIRFAEPLPSMVNMILYAVFDNVIEINQRRNILFDYIIV